MPAGGAGRLPGGEFLGGAGVVEDEQPAAVRLAAAQRVEHGGGGVRDVVAGGHAEPGGEFGELLRDVGGLLGGHPPDHVVRGLEAVRVLGGDLGLAGAAEAVEHLAEHGGGAAGEAVAEQFEQLAAADEGGVARGRLLDLRGGPGEAGGGDELPAVVVELAGAAGRRAEFAVELGLGAGRGGADQVGGGLSGERPGHRLVRVLEPQGDQRR